MERIVNSKSFRLDIEKDCVALLLKVFFPVGGKIVGQGKIEGQIGYKGWKVTPQMWWYILSNQTGEVYEIRFKLSTYSIGDLWCLYTGTGYINFTYVMKEDVLMEALESFVKSGKLEKLKIDAATI